MKKIIMGVFTLCFAILCNSQEIDWKPGNQVLESGQVKNEVGFYLNNYYVTVVTKYYRVEVKINGRITASIEPDMISSIPSNSSIMGEGYFNILGEIPEGVQISYSKKVYYNALFNILYFVVNEKEEKKNVKILMIKAFDDSQEYIPESENIIYYFTEEISPP